MAIVHKTDSNWPKVVVHADMDAFYASVEQLDNPELRGQAVIVGPNSDRGVVLTASYEARPYQVGSAMPVSLARRRCPHAVFVPPRFDRYKELSERVMKVFANFSGHVEAISLDEAFIEMSGSEAIFGGPADIARSIQQQVFEVTEGLTVSVGVSVNKYVAKVASGHKKPNGVTIVPKDAVLSWLAPQDVSRLWGAGPKTQARLKDLGYYTIGDVAAADVHLIRKQLGAMGLQFHDLANGRDPRRVARRRVAKSLSSDRTLAHDVSNPVEIRRHLQRSADRVAKRLRAKGYKAGGVRIKMKTNRFELFTRQCTISPSDTAADFFGYASRLYGELNHAGPFRLIGLAAFDLEKGAQKQQLDLFDQRTTRALEGVIDAVNGKFGDGTVHRARDIGSQTIFDHNVNLDFIEDADDEEDQP